MNQKEEYNYKQTRDDRKIDDYFKKISDNTKNDLACEFIIELEDKKHQSSLKFYISMIL